MLELAREFGTLRSLSHDPDAWNWRLLCGFLDRWARHWEDPFMQEQVLPYLRHQLDAWPEDLHRFAPHLWVQYTLEGQELPQLQMATALQFVSQKVTEQGVINLFTSPHLGRITYMDLRAVRPDDEFFFALLHASSLDHLERVTPHAPLMRLRVSRWVREELEQAPFELELAS